MHTLPIGSATRRIFFLFALTATILEVGMACNKKDANADPKIAHGQVLFAANCISCHNMNTSMDGTLGPALKGSSLELIQARVLRAEYPPGYPPKRTTHIMPKLPLTEENIKDLHAFLNAP